MKARRHVIAETYTIERSEPLPEALIAPSGRPPLGCLVLEGFIAQLVEFGVRRGRIVLGPGDVFCPWERGSCPAPIPDDESWLAMSQARLALLDLHFEAVCSQLPGVTAELMSRGLQATRSLALHRALSQLPSLQERLLVLLWHFADRWGKVTTNGVVIPLRLPHRTLAELVAASRPSVTNALNGLRQGGHLSRERGAIWHLHGHPPARVGEAQRPRAVAAV